MPNPDELELLRKLEQMESRLKEPTMPEDEQRRLEHEKKLKDFLEQATALNPNLKQAPVKKLPILCLDFDGVCHSYTSGWKGADVIPDPPVDGLFDFLLEAEEYFEIHIFSSRSLQDGGIAAMTQWFEEWREKLDKPALKPLHFPLEKPPAFVTLDDRAITFTGAWPGMETLRSFKPWNKK